MEVDSRFSKNLNLAIDVLLQQINLACCVPALLRFNTPKTASTEWEYLRAFIIQSESALITMRSEPRKRNFHKTKLGHRFSLLLA